MLPGLSGARRVEEKLYVEDVFSAYKYVGSASDKPIVNGIDLAGKGGLVWTKRRSSVADPILIDTIRGKSQALQSSTTAAQFTSGGADYITSFNSDGYTLGGGWGAINATAGTFVGWTFRKAAKFFDSVTWTGDGTTGRRISHNLGAAPGMIIVKSTTAVGEWSVYHRSTGKDQVLYLQRTNIAGASTGVWGASDPTSTDFGFATSAGAVPDFNANGNTYVAYLFGHDTSSDGIIQCGSYTGNGSTNGPTINLGWEPQYILIKSTSGVAADWILHDTARGMNLDTDNYLSANANTAEANSILITPNATGFKLTTNGNGWNGNTFNYAYVAIRKGMMRPPTDATKVFEPVGRTGTGVAATVSLSGINTGVDLAITKVRASSTAHNWQDRLRGTGVQLTSDSSGAETSLNTKVTAFNMDGVALGTHSSVNSNTLAYINYFFKQARGFLDIVHYTGTGVAHTEAHNLGVIPELITVKNRLTGSTNWNIYYGDPTSYLQLNNTIAAVADAAWWNNTAPTSSVFSLGINTAINNSGASFIAYLFASCPGVSKIGTYVGDNSSVVQVDCGFAAGARFVLIKDITGVADWHYFDTVRGIIAGNDPRLLMNSSVSEQTSGDYLVPYSPGFSVQPATNISGTGRTFLYLAIA